MRARTICIVGGCPEFAEHGSRSRGHQLRRTSGRRWHRLVARVVARDYGRCWLCGELGATTGDHVVRVREGGGDELENLHAAHVECNQRRG